MGITNVARSLLENPSFRRRLLDVAVDSAAREFAGSLTPPESLSELEHEWHHLLLSGSILLEGDFGECQQFALRVACHCLQSDSANPGEKRIAARLLNRMANEPAIRLAIARGLIDRSFEDRDPVFAAIERARNEIESQITLVNGERLQLNRFQQAFWEAVDSAQWVSVSAPTSAGKSFVVLEWICNRIRNGEFKNCVYLVPTRALISQVERDLKQYCTRGGFDINVTSVPQPSSLAGEQPSVLVFTQERLHYFAIQNDGFPEFVDAIVVDEAQKIGDGHRGILLQDVLEQAAHSKTLRSLILLSPMSANPEELLRDAPENRSTHDVTSTDVTVNQNLIWVSQAKRLPKKWDASVCIDGQLEPIGRLDLEYKPKQGNGMQRLAFVALAMAHESGNLIYVNTAASAEKTAMLLHGTQEDLSHPDIDELIELVRYSIHPKYQLVHALKRGIGFHYGDMPLLIKQKVEELFSAGVLRFLVCTSTLIEGVNTACKNIFVRGPKKGVSTLMSEDDFWNLAGRAGRLGKEFAGNIVCVDADKPQLWKHGSPPRTRKRFKVARTADRLLGSPDELIEFVTQGAPRSEASRRPDLEYALSYLTSCLNRYGGLEKAPWAAAFDQAKLCQLEKCLVEATAQIEIPAEVVTRNIGISPLALQSLLEYFRQRSAEKPVEELIPADPSSGDIAKNLGSVFFRIHRFLNVKLGPQKVSFMFGILVEKWMTGYPLSRLIKDRFAYWERRAETAKGKAKKSPTQESIIRNTMRDVEQIARFEAPRSLQAYIDVLRLFLTEIDRPDLLDELQDFGMFLELGVSQKTQVSLLELGLSRSSAIAFSEFIPEDDLSPEQCVQWIKKNPWDNFGLPMLIKKEVDSLVDQS